MNTEQNIDRQRQRYPDQPASLQIIDRQFKPSLLNWPEHEQRLVPRTLAVSQADEAERPEDHYGDTIGYGILASDWKNQTV